MLKLLQRWVNPIGPVKQRLALDTPHVPIQRGGGQGVGTAPEKSQKYSVS